MRVLMLLIGCFICSSVHAQVLLTRASQISQIQCLVQAYPLFLDSVDEHFLYWKDGMKMPLDGERTDMAAAKRDTSDYDAWLNTATLRDQMAQWYPRTRLYLPLARNYDPGRAREDALFRKMYGATAEEVQSHLRSVIWLPKHEGVKLMASAVNGVDKALQAVSLELDALPDSLMKYLCRPAGTFTWRVVAGTQRLSMHSFGIAIDLHVPHTHYWRNFKPDGNGLYEYKNRIPMVIVEIFENHGFIWGGKWYHFDTMHFEYRPELLQYSCER